MRRCVWQEVTCPADVDRLEAPERRRSSAVSFVMVTYAITELLCKLHVAIYDKSADIYGSKHTHSQLDVQVSTRVYHGRACASERLLVFFFFSSSLSSSS